MKNEEYKCLCGRIFYSSSALNAHKRYCKKAHEDMVLKKNILNSEKESRRLQNGMFVCENPDCNKEHDGSYGSGRFCSKHCRLSFNAKKRTYSSTPRIDLRSEYGRWKCISCNKIFETRAKLIEHKHEFHSSNGSGPWNKGLTKEKDQRIKRMGEKISQKLKCAFKSGEIISHKWTNEEKLKQSIRAKKRGIGGYHKNGGRGIRGWYKGFWCDSSWELAYVIYNIEHNIHFVRNTQGFPYKYNGMICHYFPDFKLDNGNYVEIKGYLDRKANIKHESFINLGYSLVVIDKTKITPYIDYVVSKYGRDFVRLYENKP